ncbi:MAG TPA: energy-coupling factor transporter transmembrane component T [Syntrophomonadaceae bacterium]|jgi:energy-coupling factor transport system permease protein|nr:energy-coupling factor transporter transmembrane component T [Syntrophomonadaceae bacterium]HRX20558.1 energy-coupling factor transporter transmembrane component T [Syntrophomonadaceae bacterium]
MLARRPAGCHARARGERARGLHIFMASSGGFFIGENAAHKLANCHQQLKQQNLTEEQEMLKNFHPRSVACYLTVWFILALFINDLKLLALMLLLVSVINFVEDHGRSLAKMLMVILPLTLIIVGLNLWLADYGKTALYVLALPWGDTWTIYREPLINSLAMGTKLVLIMAVFTIFNQVITVDKLISVFGNFSGPTVLMAVLAARMVPQLGRHARSIAEVQSLRIHGQKTVSLMDKVKRTGPFLTNLLRVSLESSLQTAEAMQVRAFGSGKRTCFVPEHWRGRDTIITTAAAALLLFIIIEVSSGMTGIAPLLLLLFICPLPGGYFK